MTDPARKNWSRLAKNAEKTPPSGCPKLGQPRILLSQIGALDCTKMGQPPQPIGNKQENHVMTFASSRGRNLAQYQRLSGKCRQLRGVCKKTRGEDPSGNRVPPWVTDRRDGFPRPFLGLRGSLIPALALIVLPFVAPAQGFEKSSWSTNGTFTLSGSLTTNAVWSRPSNAWTAFDNFEMSAPARGPSPAPQIVIGNGSVHDRLLDVIASAEAGPKGYDAIHYSATRLPARPPNQLTISEIFAWIRATPGQHHAIGRYQFIPSTLAYLVEAEGIPGSAKFSPSLQKRLALRLMFDAGYDDFLQGRMSRSELQDRLAGIWAGLPLQNGRSKYHGTAGNRATITRANFDAAMISIFGA